MNTKFTFLLGLTGAVFFIIGLPLYFTGCQNMPQGCLSSVLNPTAFYPKLNWALNQCCNWCDTNSTISDHTSDADCCAGDAHNCWTVSVQVSYSNVGILCDFHGTQVENVTTEFPSVVQSIFNYGQTTCHILQEGPPRAFRLWISGIVFLMLSLYLWGTTFITSLITSK